MWAGYRKRHRKWEELVQKLENTSLISSRMTSAPAWQAWDALMDVKPKGILWPVGESSGCPGEHLFLMEESKGTSPLGAAMLASGLWAEICSWPLNTSSHAFLLS